jgi:CheY-like chemotaxis protein/DNA-directed RNA polymerase specialized sigma24 family protein
MNLSSSIAPHLPFLRRYSRALTGDQQSGDAYVAALLEAVIADPSGMQAAADIRVALYRDFCRSASWEAAAQSHLAAISPKAREAFLLMAVEGFKAEEIGQIIACEADAVALLLEEASKTIAKQVATDVLVIEDEPIIAMDIEEILHSLGHRITGVARTEEQALELAASIRPGLILADIQLADGSSGLEAVGKILRQFEVPVIFITAFPERLLTGERPEPTFLITKPFMPDMVKAVISQALFFDTKSKVAT